jgi:hypothetical protein
VSKRWYPLLFALLLGAAPWPSTGPAATLDDFFTWSSVEKAYPDPQRAKSIQENTLTLSSGDEYNDNVNEKARKQADFVNSVSANGGYNHQSSRLKVMGSLDGSYNYYSMGNRANEFRGGGQASVSLAVVPNSIFLEGQDSFRQVFSSLVQGQTNSSDSSRGQTTQNSATFTAYATPHLGDRLALKVGVDLTSIMYNSTETTNKQGYGAFIQSAYDLTPKLQLTAETEANHESTSHGGQQWTIVAGGFMWEYTDGGTLQAKAGPRFTSYEDGGSELDPFWNVRLSQTIRRMSLSIDSSSFYVENPSSSYTSKSRKIGATVGWKNDRTSLQFRGTYSILDGGGLASTNQTSVNLTASHELTPRLSMRMSATEELSDQSGYSHTRLYADGSLIYQLAEKWSVEGYYRWKLSDSSSGGNDNYTVNKVGLQLRKSF